MTAIISLKMIWNSVVMIFCADRVRSRMLWNSQRSNSAVMYRMMWLLKIRISVYLLLVPSSRLNSMSVALPLRLFSTSYLRTFIFIAADRQLRILRRCCYIFTQVRTYLQRRKRDYITLPYAVSIS